MNIIRFPSEKEIQQIIERPVQQNIEERVLPIIHAVKENGDKALKEFALKFDGVNIKNLLVSESEFQEAQILVSETLKHSIATAKNNIEKFHAAQKEAGNKIETMPGVVCWRKSVAIEKVGLYIPGGSAPLFSTILMLAVPAKLAGCREIVLCTPPDKQGKIHPAILYTAQSLGITSVFKAGGAQAIAAMAYGTESIPKVYKIFGPGNQYVTAAKQIVTKEGVAIDMPAGPSEVAVIGDDSCEPDFVAADLLSQAEHGPDSQVIFITDSETVLSSVKAAVDDQLKKLPREQIATKALENSKAVLVNNMDEAISLSNQYAPEHLILQTKNAESLAEKVINAGSVFIGNYTPESAGDYASGTNHTLPTNAYARAYSGVSLDSFVRKITFQHISKNGLAQIGPVIENMAEAEQLFAHKNAVSIRLKK